MLKYISADCGSGKTHSLINIVNRSSEKFIIVQNTKQLITQTANQISDSTVIVSDNSDKGAMKRTLEFLVKPTSRVLIITNKTFLAIKDVNLLKNWNIYVDDIVGFHTVETIDTTKKYDIEFEIFENFEAVGNDYVSASKKEDFEDDLVKAMSRLFKVIDTNDYFIMNANFFEKTTGVGGAFTYTNKVNQLSVVSWVDVAKYKDLDITFMANDFESTLLYLANKDIFQKVEWNARERVVPIQSRMKVYYFSKKNRMSKSYRINNKDKVEKVCQYLNDNVTGDLYYTMNADAKSHFDLNGTFISPDSRGINDYMNYKTCVWLASMKPSPAESKVCETIFNLSKAELVKAREYENLYQFVNRSNLRDYESTDEVTIYVFDLEQAMSLSPSAEYIDLGLDDDVSETTKTIGYVPLALSKNKEMRLYRMNKEKLNTEEKFQKWLDKKTNSDLTEREIEHFWAKWRSL